MLILAWIASAIFKKAHGSSWSSEIGSDLKWLTTVRLAFTTTERIKAAKVASDDALKAAERQGFKLATGKLRIGIESSAPRLSDLTNERDELKRELDALKTTSNHQWVLIAVPIAVAVGLLLLWLARALDPVLRRRLLIAGIVFLAGAVGGEVVGGLIVKVDLGMASEVKKPSTRSRSWSRRPSRSSARSSVYAQCSRT